ncbi:sulfite exporter TauE/SafE family protein [Paenibacillus contaminans]|uniref:Probable membrane transporter protein n=1 Tax=Paenibacillus contaminans TaxID=450362 RepID=A0A329MLV9_9BACL|nr:sulfite exporter TauE/SafE family protein [Paenibacillus contaminans]RAV19703.1 hypothetical protein DQG23_19830 [Paenibacillus contaminans]
MEWALTFGVVLMAATLQAGTGFGFSILAIPLLLVIHHNHSAVSAALLLSLISSFTTLPRVIRDIDWSMLRRLLIGSLIGLPFGGLLFQVINIYWLKMFAGISILIFAVPMLLKLKLPLGKGFGIGGLSGFLGASVGMPGPPVVLFMLANHTEKNTFRGTSILYYCIVNSISLCMQWTSGHSSFGDMPYVLYSLPAIFFGQAIGLALGRKLNQVWFTRATFSLLLLTGIQAIVSGM